MHRKHSLAQSTGSIGAWESLQCTAGCNAPKQLCIILISGKKIWVGCHDRVLPRLQLNIMILHQIIYLWRGPWTKTDERIKQGKPAGPLTTYIHLHSTRVPNVGISSYRFCTESQLQSTSTTNTAWRERNISYPNVVWLPDLIEGVIHGLVHEKIRH